MLLLVVAAVLSIPSEIERVLSARTSFAVLGISVTADAAQVRSAHRRIMRAVHPDRHCRSPQGAVCETAHRASLLVNNARDALLSEKKPRQRSARKPRAARRQQAPWEEPPTSLVRLLAPLCFLALTELLSRAVRRRWQQRQLRQAHMPAARLLSTICRQFVDNLSTKKYFVSTAVSARGCIFGQFFRRARARRNFATFETDTKSPYFTPQTACRLHQRRYRGCEQ